MKVDKQLLEAARPQIEAALKELGEKLGVTIKVGSGNYEPDGSAGVLKLELGEVREDGVSAEEIAFRKVCSLYGLKPEDYGKKLKIRTETFKLVGLNTRAPKKPVEIERIPDGAKFKTGENILKQIKD
ncbi:MAG: hypothetical protein P8J32_04725 [bacterium]|nr:hypothetical protein [bacterium]